MSDDAPLVTTTAVDTTAVRDDDDVVALLAASEAVLRSSGKVAGVVKRVGRAIEELGTFEPIGVGGGVRDRVVGAQRLARKAIDLLDRRAEILATDLRSVVATLPTERSETESLSEAEREAFAVAEDAIKKASDTLVLAAKVSETALDAATCALERAATETIAALAPDFLRPEGREVPRSMAELNNWDLSRANQELVRVATKGTEPLEDLTKLFADEIERRSVATPAFVLDLSNPDFSTNTLFATSRAKVWTGEEIAVRLGRS